MALLLGSTAVRAETLADTLAFGYESSGLIEQNRAVLRAADEDVAQAVASLRPVLSWQAELARSFTRNEDGLNLTGDTSTVSDSASLSLLASLTLYDGGQRRLTIDLQKEVVLATREGLRDTERQVLEQIVTAYQEVRRRSAFVSLRESNVRVIGQELQAARDRFEVGEITRTDVALAEAQLAAARSELVADQGGLAQAVAAFRAAVGRAPGQLQPAAPARVPATLDEAVQIALRTHPALRQAQHQVAANEIAILSTEASLRPQVQLEARPSINNSLDGGSSTLGASIGLSAGGEIYSGGARASQIRQAQADRDASRAQLIETSRNIVQSVSIAYSNLEVARATLVAFQEQVRAAQSAFEGVREEATLGARTTLDVLEAEQDLLDARTNLAGAEIDEVLASYQVLSAAGLLTVENLGLAVAVYDPTAYYNLVDDAPARGSEQGRALDRVLQSIGAGD
ncbi:TolC family outer membrane protein [Rubellimicrobium roseum]|uniref:TolC family outer membrane protein n=2 Tax=Rubellimicrobium roseum TaxID=687525 RepID=A0A5C4NG67_9RHOB|nr:TolC family outer membrane protein [Rubellimicrobium roseum]